MRLRMRIMTNETHYLLVQYTTQRRRRFVLAQPRVQGHRHRETANISSSPHPISLTPLHGYHSAHHTGAWKDAEEPVMMPCYEHNLALYITLEKPHFRGCGNVSPHVSSFLSPVVVIHKFPPLCKEAFLLHHDAADMPPTRPD